MHEASLHEEIVKVASDIFERSGRIGGRDLDNWLEAERIVFARRIHQQNLKTRTSAEKTTATVKESIPEKVKEKKNRKSSRKKYN